MNLKKLGTALVVVLALGAVMVSSASAAGPAKTEDVKWRDAGGELKEPQSIKLTKTENGVLVSKIAGNELKLESTALSCTGCTISNSGGTAVGSGVIVFENVTVPSNPLCAVEGNKVTTNSLSIEADWMIEKRNFVKFFPTSGTTFATVKLVKGTGTCAISGSYGVTGVVFGETEPTKTQLADQPVKFSGLINEEASGLTEPLKFKAEPATLKGAATASTVIATMNYWTE